MHLVAWVKCLAAIAALLWAAKPVHDARKRPSTWNLFPGMGYQPSRADLARETLVHSLPAQSLLAAHLLSRRLREPPVAALQMYHEEDFLDMLDHSWDNSALLEYEEVASKPELAEASAGLRRLGGQLWRLCGGIDFQGRVHPLPLPVVNCLVRGALLLYAAKPVVETELLAAEERKYPGISFTRSRRTPSLARETLLHSLPEGVLLAGEMLSKQYAKHHLKPPLAMPQRTQRALRPTGPATGLQVDELKAQLKAPARNASAVEAPGPIAGEKVAPGAVEEEEEEEEQEVALEQPAASASQSGWTVANWLYMLGGVLGVAGSTVALCGAPAVACCAQTQRVVVHEQGTQLETYFEKGELLADGGSSQVFKCRSKASGAVRASKTLRKDSMAGHCYKGEVAILSALQGGEGSSHIVRLYEVFEDPVWCHLVLEYLPGGELYERQAKVGVFTEAQSAYLFDQMLEAIGHVHARGVVHRDLKLENWLLVSEDRLDVKLADFGLSTFLKPGERATAKVGSPYYVAPEVLVGDYDHRIDLWSLGVTLHMFLTGTAPFNGQTPQEILQSVRAAPAVFDTSRVRACQAARDAIQGLLQKDAEKRPTVAALRGKGSWVRKQAKSMRQA